MSTEIQDRPLAGQLAAITGASKGIGLGIAARFVSAGANVVRIARGVETLKDACGKLGSGAGATQSVVPLAADTADRAAIADVFRAIRSEVPELNIFVANAGSGTIVPFLELPADEWDRTLALNLTGTVLCCQQAARMMADTPTGPRRSEVQTRSGTPAPPGALAVS